MIISKWDAAHQKFDFFLHKRTNFLVTINISAKKLRGQANFGLLYTRTRK